MKLTDFGVAVLEGDRLSGDVERAGQLACADDWLQTFAPYIPTGGVVCDIGAALGDHTASYARMVGSTGTVHAFEPFEPFLDCLEHNARVMEGATVHTYGAALGATETRGAMVQSETQPDNLGMTHLALVPDGPTCVTTLDRMAAHWTRLDFVKIDVEGSEPLVLDGALETLRKFQPVLLIEIQAQALKAKGFTPEDVHQRVRALGYAIKPSHPGDTRTTMMPENDILCLPARLLRRVDTPKRTPSRAMHVHLLAVPNTQTTDQYPLDGFCTRTQLFAALLKQLGHSVVLYGVGENTAPCDAFVPVMSTDEQKALMGDGPYQHVMFNPASQLFQTFNARASELIRVAKNPRDVIATIAGLAQQSVSEHNPELRFLEYSVGYQGVCAPFRIFQSHAWRHTVSGAMGLFAGREFDAVIPPWFPVNEFPFSATADDYVAYVGRIVPAKGIRTVCDAAERAGVRLKLMGHGVPDLITYGEWLGEGTMAERNALLSRAKAVLMPTQYLEPFGNVAAEAQLCGTPMITTDYGAFPESVEQGVSGFRCSSLGEFVSAIDRVGDLDRRAIRARAERLYSTETALRNYEAYFHRFDAVGGEGWRSLDPGLETAPRPVAADVAA